MVAHATSRHAVTIDQSQYVHRFLIIINRWRKGSDFLIPVQIRSPIWHHGATLYMVVVSMLEPAMMMYTSRMSSRMMAA